MTMFRLRIYFIISLMTIFPLSCSDDSGGGQGFTWIFPEVYDTAEEINEILNQEMVEHPNIVAVKNLGQSVKGRDIKCIIISDNPHDFENEPTVRLTGGIHGNEPVSVDLLMRYMNYLLDNYDTDSDIRAMVDSTYIVIVPVMNPDGYMRGRRYNDNEVDLNRNFFSDHYEAGGSHGAIAFSEPESRAIRDMLPERRIHSSLTFHSGSVVVNIPFDYGSEEEGILPAENDLVRHMGKTYTTAGTFLSNPKLYSSEYVEDGIINGGNWYKITGSMQDWNYLEYGCLDLTVEVAKQDPKEEEALEEVFNYNGDSITAYIEASGVGVRGRVLDSSGNPLEGVEVHVTGGDLITQTDSRGYYFKILLPGDYTLNFHKAGYSAKTCAVTVEDGESVEKNIELN